MCMECDGMTREQVDEWLRHVIRQRGWAIMCVEGDGVEPSFGYTIGLSRYGHPEVIVFGEHPDCCTQMLDRIGDQVRHGCRFDEGSDLAGVFPEEHAELLRFPDSTTHLLRANEFYRPLGGPAIPALQLYFPRRVPLLQSPWSNRVDRQK